MAVARLTATSGNAPARNSFSVGATVSWKPAGTLTSPMVRSSTPEFRIVNCLLMGKP